MQVLVFGNTKEEESKKFCDEVVLKNFEILDAENKSNDHFSLSAGCIYAKEENIEKRIKRQESIRDY